MNAKTKRSFVPTLSDARLENREVLSTVGSGLVHRAVATVIHRNAPTAGITYGHGPNGGAQVTFTGSNADDVVIARRRRF